MRNIIIPLLLLCVFGAKAQVSQTDIINSLKEKITLTNQQEKKIEHILSGNISFFEVEENIFPLFTEDQVKTLIGDRLTNEATQLAKAEMQSVGFCKPVSQQLQIKLQSLLTEKYFDLLLTNKMCSNKELKTQKQTELALRHNDAVINFLFTNNLIDAKYSQIFACQDLLQLTSNQKELIASAYLNRIEQIKEINKDGIFNSLAYTQANKQYNETLARILNETQFDYYLELSSLPRVNEMTNNTMNELDANNLLDNKDRKKIEKEIHNYYLEEEKTNKKYEWDYDQRQVVKSRLQENRPAMLRQLKSAKQLNAQGKHYQGNFQW